MIRGTNGMNLSSREREIRETLSAEDRSFPTLEEHQVEV